MAIVTIEDIKKDPEISVYIKCSKEYLGNLGFTEHGKRHVSIVAKRARDILEKLNFPRRDCELVEIAGYVHDIANMINRFNHGGMGAVLVYSILTRLKMPPEEIALVISAVGNHEEESGNAVNHVASALIIADKSDVHRTRVTNQDFATFEIHDRVNYAAECSEVRVDEENKTIKLLLTIDTNICPVMEYFEIFLARMIMCRRAAAFLKCKFGLVINGNQLL